MADKAQKHAEGATRAIVENATTGLIAKEIGTNIATSDASGYTEELIYRKSGGGFFHIPTLERLDDYTASKSGASLIGVEDNSFGTITGDTDLQTCIDSIDTALGNVASITNAILKNGSVAMEENWNMEKDLTVNNPNSHTFPLDFNLSGDGVVADSSSLGAEKLTNGALTSGTSWSSIGDVTLANDRAEFSNTGGGSGTITQVDGAMVSSLHDDTWYLFQYTVSSYVAGSNDSLYLSQTASGGNDLTISDGTHYEVFKTDSSATGENFVINYDSDDTCSFNLDDISLKELTGGNLDVNGNFFVPNMKTGTTQVGAGAVYGELWADSDDDYTVKLGQ